MTRRAFLVAAVLSLGLAAPACPPSPVPPDASVDGGNDAGKDAVADAPHDAAPDAIAFDAGGDAGSDPCTIGRTSAPMFGSSLPPKPPETDDLASATDLCAKAPPGGARCLGKVVHKTTRAGRAKPLGAALPYGYGPAQIHGGYALPIKALLPQTIGIVIAFHDPNTKADLDTYDSTYGLSVFPSCSATASPPVTTGCFEKVNQDGAASPLPSTDAGWAMEQSMDVQASHAVCQDCKILVVEARSASFADLAAAVNTAVRLGATQVSNSYGGADATRSAAYDHAGVAIVASSGDDGYAGGPSAPASYDTVVAVGGTSLFLTTDNKWTRESAWSGAGSGCSSLNVARGWQASATGWALAGCGAKRGVADVAAVADPQTGAAVYHSTPYSGQTGWFQMGGTSLSAPIVAAIFALRADGKATSYPASLVYERSRCLRDVTTGTNGTCASTICKGAAGYDGPTGMGAPFGAGAF